MDKINVNIGIMGHVDCGKTSLCKALSSVASTASFDKSPQSQQRGITLDLGFSCFNLQNNNLNKIIQYTLVDCPGHASLIRTVLGASQIIDYVALVIDITTGIQTQTSECLVLAEILGIKLFVILSKVDLIEENNREKYVTEFSKKIKMIIDRTIYKNCPIISFSSKIPEIPNFSIQNIKNFLLNNIEIPNRITNEKFIFCVDHCFVLKGFGCVFTGTVLNGSIDSNSTIDIPSLNCTKKIKSIQVFHEVVNKIIQGDRAAIAVSQFDSTKFERGLICWPSNVLSHVKLFIGLIKPVVYYKNDITSSIKYHLTISFETSLCNLYFFESTDEGLNYDSTKSYKFKESLKKNDKNTCLAIIALESSVITHVSSATKFIGSKLDSDLSSKSCRLCFYGYILQSINLSNDEDISKLPRIYKNKEKKGLVDKIQNDNQNLIVHSMFKRLSNINDFVGFQISLSTGQKGRIESSFGQSGKVKVYLNEPLSTELATSFKKDKKQISVNLDYKKFVTLKIITKNNIMDKKSTVFQ